MLDLKFIKENAEAVKANIAARFMDADVDEVIRLYDRRNAAIAEVEELRRKRNENAAAMKGKLENEVRQKLIEEGKALKEDVRSSNSRWLRVPCRSSARMIPVRNTLSSPSSKSISFKPIDLSHNRIVGIH